MTSSLPPIDVHAHVDPSVTARQIDALDGAIVFAMTRTLDEARAARHRSFDTILWGCGVHPGLKSALNRYEAPAFRALAEDFALIGEIGLDGTRGNLARQLGVFASILQQCADLRVVFSIHSANAQDQVLDVISSHSTSGAILHWFTGNEAQIQRAYDLGCYFSVNAAMTNLQMQSMPPDRLLPETDFPATVRRSGIRTPGSTSSLEARVAKILGEPVGAVRERWYRNLDELVATAMIRDRLPKQLGHALTALQNR